jgi:hypothetical protein
MKNNIQEHQPLDWLEGMNHALADLERNLVEHFEKPIQPVIFVVGAPRAREQLC